MNAKTKRIWNIITLVLIVAGLLGFAYPLAANIYDWFHQTTITEQAKSEWDGLSAAEASKEFELAQRYNEQLAAAARGSGVSVVRPTGAGISEPKPAGTATGSGISKAKSKSKATDSGASKAKSKGKATDSGVSKAKSKGKATDSGVSKAKSKGKATDSGVSKAKSKDTTTGSGISKAKSKGTATGSGISGAEPTGTASGAAVSAPAKQAPVRYDDVFRSFSVFSMISIPSIGIDTLPIRHGVSDEVLWQGAGHLPNTSFPIGGDSTHAVITAHSGLINHSYFTDLPRIKKGDYFYFNTLGRKLAYRVVSVKTINPTDTDAIVIVPGKDLASLITCVPIGINTHRLLVTGERADDAPEPSGMGWLRPLLSGLALLALLLLLLLLLLPYSTCRIVITKTGCGGGAGSVRAFDWGIPGLHSEELSDEEGNTYVEGRLRFAIRTGNNLLVKRKNKKGKNSNSDSDNRCGNDNGESKNKGKSKHIGRVVRIFVRDDEDRDDEDRDGEDRDGDGRDGDDRGTKGGETMRGDGWREVDRAKARTLVRFEVEDLDTCEMPHDTLVKVRRHWSLAVMMCLPLSFAIPLFLMSVYGDASVYAALSHETQHSSAPNQAEAPIGTALIVSLLFLAELIIIRLRLRPTITKQKNRNLFRSGRNQSEGDKRIK